MHFKEDLAEKTDEELVALSLQHKEYFGILVGRYEEKLARYIRRISNARTEDREDMLQDIFIKTYIDLNDFHSDLKFSSWIYRIAHNHVVDVFRKNKSRAHGNLLDIDDAFLHSLGADDPVLENIDQTFLREHIQRTLNMLDEKYREVLILRYFEEKDYKEISDILKKPVGTVATLLNRGKEELRKHLDSMGKSNVQSSYGKHKT